MSAEILTGDCLAVMPTLDADSIDAIVSDPPYGLGFMGKAWDHGVPGVEFWREALRVAKPGAYLAAFGGTRTYHRLTCAIEDAGWEIHDCLSWLYGSGFPKHASKLKPAWEPIVLARKPAKYATPLNIDGCRIEGVPPSVPQPRFNSPTGAVYGFKAGEGRNGEMSHASGRWPANVCLDEGAAALLDAQSAEKMHGAGAARDGSGTPRKSTANMFGVQADTGHMHRFGDTGGASRFFYCAKASRRERNAGLENFPLHARGTEIGQLHEGVSAAGNKTGRYLPRANNHPTVKPLALMRWLCRLVTPPGGLILDPFTGSGSTGCAAIGEGFRFVGVELSDEYAAIARARIAATQLPLEAA